MFRGSGAIQVMFRGSDTIQIMFRGSGTIQVMFRGSDTIQIMFRGPGTVQIMFRCFLGWSLVGVSSFEHFGAKLFNCLQHLHSLGKGGLL